MALRTGHGTGKGGLRIEVMPPDELPDAVPGPVAVPSRPVQRGQDGKLLDSEAARELGRRGGLAKARRVRLVDSLGLATIAEQSSFAPYRTAAEDFVKAHLAELAAMAGGVVGSGPSTMVTSAAWQLAASRWAFDQGAIASDVTLMKLGSGLANDSRQNLLAAYEMATREAPLRLRKKADEAPWLESSPEKTT